MPVTDLTLALQTSAVVLVIASGVMVMLRPYCAPNERKSLAGGIWGSVFFALSMILFWFPLPMHAIGEAWRQGLAHTGLVISLAFLQWGIRRFTGRSPALIWLSLQVLAMGGLSIAQAVLPPTHAVWIPSLAQPLVYVALLSGTMAVLVGRIGLKRTALNLLAGVHGFALVALVAEASLPWLPAGRWHELVAAAANPLMLLVLGILPLLAFLLFLVAILQRTMGQLRASARVDFLTSVYNQRGLEELGDRMILTARRAGEGLGVLMIDLDRFKRINQRYDYRVGDEALVAFADRLGRGLRSSDVLARVGGEEFVVLLAKVDGPTAHKVADRIQRLLSTEPYKLSVGPVDVTCSIGVTVLQPTDADIRALLRRAAETLAGGE